MHTQWQIDSGMLAGLDYNGARVAARAAGYNFDKIFHKIQIMEDETIKISTERAKQAAAEARTRARK